jgi:hypothetical protein
MGLRPAFTRRRRKVLTALGPVVLVLALAGAAVAADPPSFSVSDPSVTEGDSGTKNANFLVSLSAASPDTVTVAYATSDGSATAQADYAPASGTLTFAPGETAKTVTVLVNGDTLDEHHETVFLNLANPSNAGLAELRGVGAILDNDPLPQLSVSDTSASEGGPAVFTATLSAPSGKSIAVYFSTADGTATALDDYSTSSDMVSFAPGETSKTIAVATTEDAAVESDETFYLNLFNPTNVTLSDSLGTATITDDDTAPLPPEEPQPPPTEPPPPPPPDEPPPPPPPAEEPPAEEPPAEDPPAEEPPAEEPPAEEPSAEGPSAAEELPANTAPDCSGVEPSERRLWPPNHKFRTVTLSGATDADGDSLTLWVLGITQDEPVRSRARGDKGPDARWAAGRLDSVELRVERDAKANGRAYRIEFTVRDGMGGECSGTALAGVPHDAKHRWVDSGASFNSFGG